MANKPTGPVMEKSHYHHGDLRASLLDVAAKIIREKGVESLSLRVLAQRVGVSRTALYHHFDDKHALLCALAEDGFKRNAAWGEKHRPRSGSPAVQVEQLIRNYLKFALKYPEYYNLMYGSDVWKSRAPTESLKTVAHNAFRAYVNLVADWQKAGIFPDDVEALRFAQVTWGTLHGLARLLIDGIYVDTSAMEPMCRATVKMFLAGC